MKKVFAIAALLLIIGAETHAGVLTIRFRPEAVVDGDEVTLGAVAALSPPGRLADQLSGMTLAVAPQPGEELRMQRSDLWSRACRLEPSLAKANPGGAGVIVVRRAGIQFGPQNVKRLLEKYLALQQERFPGLELRLVKLQLPKPFVLPKGSLRTEIRPSNPDVLHSRSFNILFKVKGRPVRNLSVRGRIEALAEVPTLVRDLPRGALLEPTDLRLVKQDIVPLRDPVLDLRELQGKKTMRRLRRGQFITRNMVTAPPVIRRGEVVTMSLQHGALRLSTRGIARRNGGTGDTIPVRNSNSQRDVLCKVIGPGQVKVGF